MTLRTFGPGSAALRGVVEVPGDKSLSHRAVLFAALAEGTSRIAGVLDSEDVRATISAVSALGASVHLTSQADGSLAGEVTGWGAQGPVQPNTPIDCGNSGTTARLLLGVLAGWPITVTLVGDESLSRRPMARVIEPLSRMGATFDVGEGQTLPVTVHGVDALKPLSYVSAVASAQVKTALLLAGLRAVGGVKVTEPAPSRDHTELLLPAFGIDIVVHKGECSAAVHGPVVPKATTIAVPRDPSSAAFPVCAACIVDGSTVSVPGVSLNETRIGFVKVLQRMGADLAITHDAALGAEPVGTISITFVEPLSATVVTSEEIPSLVDEVPVLALVAARAVGTTRFEGVAELRVKESDRLSAVAQGLEALGVTTRAGADWLEVDGPAALHGATLDSLGDHRLAMTWALAGLVADQPVEISRFDAVNVSYPAFSRDIEQLQQ